MVGYKVVLVPPKGDRLDLIVPFDGSLTFNDLTAAVLDRAGKHRSLPSTIRQEWLRLRLGSEDGFMIEPEDTVQDVITSSDVLYILFEEGPDGMVTAAAPPGYYSSLGPAVQIRVVTPVRAHGHEEPQHIPLLQDGLAYSTSTTLDQIKTDVAKHLDLPSYRTSSLGALECHCNFADLLVKRGIWDKFVCKGHVGSACTFDFETDPPGATCCGRCSQSLSEHMTLLDDPGDCQSYVLLRRDLGCAHVVHSQCLVSENGCFECPDACYSMPPPPDLGADELLVISSPSNIEYLRVTDRTRSGLETAVRIHFGGGFMDTRSIHFRGGLMGVNDTYQRLPVVALCAQDRHGEKSWTTSSDEHISGQIELDLHTVEGPINTANLDLSLDDAKLTDLAVDGVLTFYAVERRPTKEENRSPGMDGLFKAAAHWTLPSLPQSNRGMAAFLASLRVFAHIVGAEDFDDRHQNETLRLFHLVTRFPPAVRALHILMDGKRLRPNESAALVQSVAAVTTDLIPPGLIGDDVSRSLEGTRLLLGLILRRAHQAVMKEDQDESVRHRTGLKRPYIAAYHTVDVMDAKTLEPVVDPVLTQEGMVNQAVFTAFQKGGGILKDSPSSTLVRSDDADCRPLRIALLYGGVRGEAPYYEADALGAALCHSLGSDRFLQEFSNLSQDMLHLAALCEETKLVVVSPRQLSTTREPSLTLDRYGNMAVYTGRAACAAPGQDHAIFHPLTGVEANVDVHLVAQLLDPIVRSREQDGTYVFDLFSASFRQKDTHVREMLVFCVDCSRSMNSSSDFAELNSDDLVSPSEENLPDLLEDAGDSSPSLEEIKDFLLHHESWDDMLALVSAPREWQARGVAENVIQFLRDQISRQIVHLVKNEGSTALWATRAVLSPGYKLQRQGRLDSLRRSLSGLITHEQALCDFLVFRARAADYAPQEFSWHFGDAIPSMDQSKEPENVVDMSEFCVVPPDFICPISHTVFEDPVNTSDGFTFDRKAIERWYRIRRSSPLTGLPVTDTTLRHHQLLSDQIKNWVNASDITAALPSAPSLIRNAVCRLTSSRSLTVHFVTPAGRFTRVMPRTAALADLHKVAFRGMRGVYARFTLLTDGRPLPSTDITLLERGLKSGTSVVVSTATPSEDSTHTEEEMCLIQVYAGTFQSQKFAYWHPLHGETSVASIIFKYWRFLQQGSKWHGVDKDKVAWTNLMDAGDGRSLGDCHHSWDPLSELLENLEPVEIRKDARLYESLQAQARERSQEDTNKPADSESQRLQYPRRRVLKVALFPYKSSSETKKAARAQQRTLTRMDVTKQIFSAFINRLIAYNFPTNVGLVTFGMEAKVSQQMTNVIENFRQSVDGMSAHGDTALWDAIALAADQLVEAGRQDPKIKKRIICLSDGQDTCSRQDPMDVCRMLLRNEIVVDSCSIGNEINSKLKTLSYLTGGYKFVPQTLEEAVAICELEPVLSQHERLPIVRPFHSGLVNFAQAAPYVKVDFVTRDHFPARKSHENLADTFVHIGVMERSTGLAALQTVPSTRSRRLLTEIRDLAAHPHPSYDVYVSESNMGFWKVVLKGPPESAYSTGTFVLYLDMDDDYPRRPPKGRFVTPIFHPNINRHGRICHSIFDRNWTVDTTNKQILDTVFGLLLVPEFTDPINTVVTLNYYWDEVAFQAEVEKHIEKYAKMSREELGRDILGGD